MYGRIQTHAQTHERAHAIRVHTYALGRLFRVRAVACMCTHNQWCTYAYLVYTHADAQITSVQWWREVKRLGEHRSVRKSFCFMSVYTNSHAIVERERTREISRTLRVQRSAAHLSIAHSHFFFSSERSRVSFDNRIQNRMSWHKLIKNCNTLDFKCLWHKLRLVAIN